MRQFLSAASPLVAAATASARSMTIHGVLDTAPEHGANVVAGGRSLDRLAARLLNRREREAVGNPRRQPRTLVSMSASRDAR